MFNPGSAETGSLPRGDASSPEPFKVPAKLGAYRVLGRIGEGGQGLVFRGHDDVLDRPVALKVLARGAGELSDLDREARAVAAVAHPNVVQVYSAGEQDGLAWFAMELVPGPDLRDVLEREGPLPEARARRYLAQASRGLRAAQRKNVFHRDVKPGNLLLDPRDDQVKVADFGLAQRGAVAASLTRSGLTGGTPLYVAPEVIRDGVGDERADIYSLGATFFHLLTGRPPFGGASAADALVGHMTLPAPDVRSLRPDVSPELASILLRCLTKAPADRYPSYDALIEAVEIVPAGAAIAPSARASTPTPATPALPTSVPVTSTSPTAALPQGRGPIVVTAAAAAIPTSAVPTDADRVIARDRASRPTPRTPTPARTTSTGRTRAPRPSRARRFLVLACVGFAIVYYGRVVRPRESARVAAARAAARAEMDQARAENARQDEAIRRRPANTHSWPWASAPPAPTKRPPPPPTSGNGPPVEPPLVQVPPRSRFPLSVEPAFSQVAWSVRTIGANAFPDELTPIDVERACGASAADSSGVQLSHACTLTHLPYAVIGPASSLHGLVAWHVHDRNARVVLCVDQEGNERATTILQLLLWLHARADEQGVPWETVVRKVRPFLPADVDTRELEQIDETY